MDGATSFRAATESLSEPTVFALRTCWAGFCTSDSRGRDVSKHLLSRFSGPSGMDGFGRAALAYASSTEPFSQLREIIIETIKGWLPAPVPEPQHFVTALLQFIEAGRPALVLGQEVSVLGISDFIVGYLAATEHNDPDMAARLKRELSDFDAWTSAYYGYQVPWPLLLRCFEGPGADGCRQFGKLWRSFEKDRSTCTPSP